MKTKILGRTGLEVTIIGLGTIYIGSRPSGPPNDLDEEIGAQTVEAAIEAGCTLIDTAPLYGGTVAEKIIGNVLRNRPDLAAKCTVVTKAGNYVEGKNHSFDNILRSVEASLERLGLKQLDVVYIHDTMGVPMEQIMSKDGALGALRKLQNEGVVRFIGSASNDPPTNTPYIETGEFDAAVVPDAWTLLTQEAAERILPAAEKYNIGISCATPLEIGHSGDRTDTGGGLRQAKLQPRMSGSCRQDPTALPRLRNPPPRCSVAVAHPPPAGNNGDSGGTNPRRSRRKCESCRDRDSRSLLDRSRPADPTLGERNSPIG